MTLDAVLAVIQIFSAACYLALGLQLVVGRQEPGAMSIGMLLVVISFWVLGGAVELMSNSFVGFSIGRTGHFVGTSFLPVAAYVCFRQYTGRSTSVHRIVMLLIIPVVSVSLAATNASHEFMWYAPFANDMGDFLTRPESWGRGFCSCMGLTATP